MRAFRTAALPSQQIISFLCITCLICVFLTSFAVRAAAQDPAAGIQPFSTLINGAYDSVDISTNNVLLAIPVRNKDGKIPFSFKLVMNEHPYATRDPLLKTYNWNLAFPKLSGEVMGAGPSITLPTPTLCNSRVSPSLVHYLIVIDSTGASHNTTNLPHILDTLSPQCWQNTFPQTVTTTDGSGYTVVMNGFDSNSGAIQANIYDKSGNTFQGFISPQQPPPPVYIQDPDGAQISWSADLHTSTQTFTDTLGTTPVTVDLSAGPMTVKYNWTDAAAKTQTIQVNSTQKTQKTDFACTNVNDIKGTTLYAPTSIQTPMGTYQLSYEQTPNDSTSITGRIASITYPTGGKVSYIYGGTNNGVVCGVGSAPTLTRNIYDATTGATSTWTYANTAADSWGNTSITVTDPARTKPSTRCMPDSR